MRIGAVFPTCEIGNDPVVIRDFAQAAEGLGYSHIVIYDHVLGAEHDRREPLLPQGLYDERDPFHEPFVLFGYLAAVTSRLEMATGVLVLPQRQTALVAKQAAEVDLLSHGRLRVGVATGWNHVEYEALGVPFAGRGRRLEEQVEVLRALWREPIVDFTGSYHRIDRANIVPRPAHDIPIWFGGYSDGALRRAARLGDGFIFGRSGRSVVAKAQQLRDLVAAEGRAAEAFPMEAIVHYAGGVDSWVQDMNDWAAVGGTHFSMRAMSTGAGFLGQEGTGFTTPREHIDALETFMAAVAH